MHSTLRGLAYGTSTVEEQRKAATVFKSVYDGLAFPGGFDAGLRRIEQVDCEAIEYALAFLEVRPYFYRSQYMRKKIIRVLKRVGLTLRQRNRLDKILEFEDSRKGKGTVG